MKEYAQVAAETLAPRVEHAKDSPEPGVDLALRPGQCRGACKRGCVAVFVNAIEQRFTCAGGDRPEGDANSRARVNKNALADGEDWIEDSAD